MKLGVASTTTCFVRLALSFLSDVPISGTESTLKVGGAFRHFSYFLPISESGGITKSRPIDPFFDVVYLFLNVRFGQKVFKFTVFGCHDLRFACIICYLFAVDSTFFTPFP